MQRRVDVGALHVISTVRPLRSGTSISSTQMALGEVGQNSSHTMQGVAMAHGRQRPWS
jgi:hypothetical protein